MVTTRGGKTPCDPPYPNHARTNKKSIREVEDSDEGPSDTEKPPQVRKVPTKEKVPEGKPGRPEFVETHSLPFPQ